VNKANGEQGGWDVWMEESGELTRFRSWGRNMAQCFRGVKEQLESERDDPKGDWYRERYQS
jgi:hypothetical protein